VIVVCSSTHCTLTAMQWFDNPGWIYLANIAEHENELVRPQ